MRTFQYYRLQSISIKITNGNQNYYAMKRRKKQDKLRKNQKNLEIIRNFDAYSPLVCNQKMDSTLPHNVHYNYQLLIL